MIRVVLDTNIILSALLNPLGPPAQIVLSAADRSVELCVSGDVYAEYEEVIHRPALRLSAAAIAAMLRWIRENALWVRTPERVQACDDANDNVFLECAQAAKAHYLVTGNLPHFPARWGDTRVVLP
jgi:putative PIN family toxin of toxin-antitoxin system